MRNHLHQLYTPIEEDLKIDTSRHKAKALIFAGGVLSSISDATLVNYFSNYGKVYNFRRAFNKEKKECGYAFFEVDYPTSDLIVAQPHLIGDALINCKLAADNTKIAQTQKDEMERKIFVSNLPMNTTDLDLYYYFGEIGKLSKAYMVRNRFDGTTKNFGFVIFQTHNELQKVLRMAENLSFRGRKISVRQARDRVTQKVILSTPVIAKFTDETMDPNVGSTEESTLSQALRVSYNLNQSTTNYRLNIDSCRIQAPPRPCTPELNARKAGTSLVTLVSLDPERIK